MFPFVSAFYHFSNYTQSLAQVFLKTRGKQGTRRGFCPGKGPHGISLGFTVQTRTGRNRGRGLRQETGKALWVLLEGGPWPPTASHPSPRGCCEWAQVVPTPQAHPPTGATSPRRMNTPSCGIIKRNDKKRHAPPTLKIRNPDSINNDKECLSGTNDKERRCAPNKGGGQWQSSWLKREHVCLQCKARHTLPSTCGCLINAFDG